MNIFFTQIYIESDAYYSFTHHFQKYLSKKISSLTKESSEFNIKYGGDWELSFNISAKKNIEKPEIKGPAIYKKDKDIEYTIFLPFSIIKTNEEAIIQILECACNVLDSLGIETIKIKENQNNIINSIIADATMFEI